MSARRWNSSGSRSPTVSTAICTNFAPPPAPPVPLRREPREVAVVVEARRLPEPRVQRGHLLDDVARPPRDVVVLRDAGTGTRSRRGLRAPSRSASPSVSANHTLGNRAPGSRARGRGRSAPRRHPCRPTSTNSRWRSSNGASFTNTVAGTPGSPRQRDARAPVVPELWSSSVDARRRRARAPCANHSGVRSATSSGSTGVRLRAAD